MTRRVTITQIGLMIVVVLQVAELFEETEAVEDAARMILEGAAYFDVEAKDGEWIRILCEYGDLIIIPAGRMYRMTTTAKVSANGKHIF